VDRREGRPSDWRPTKKINILAQFSTKKHPELQDVPTVVELARNDEQRQVLTAVVNAAEIGTAFFTPAECPERPCRCASSRLRSTMKDPEFLAEARKTQLHDRPPLRRRAAKARREVPQSHRQFWKRSAPPT